MFDSFKKKRTIGSLIIVRITFSVVLATLAWYSTLFVISQITRKAGSEFALQVRPSDAIALAVAADRLLLESLEHPKLQIQVRDLATQSLLDQALNPKALRVLSFVIADPNSQQPLISILKLATRVSRREVGVHLLMIDDRVADDDVRGALHYYNLALTTSSESAPVLMPKLVAALDEDEILSELSTLVRTRPVWLQAFLGEAIRSYDNPTRVAKLITMAGGWPDGAAYDHLAQSLIKKMVEKGQYKEAKRHYLSLDTVDPTLLTSTELSTSSLSERFGILAWQPSGTSSVGMTRITSGPRDQSLTLFASAADRATVGRKMLFLGSGVYTLAVRFGEVQVANGANVTFGITCLGALSETAIWRSAAIVPRPTASFSSTIRIPALCDAQNVDIEISGGIDQQATEIEITSILLKKVTK